MCLSVALTQVDVSLPVLACPTCSFESSTLFRLFLDHGTISLRVTIYNTMPMTSIESDVRTCILQANLEFLFRNDESRKRAAMNDPSLLVITTESGELNHGVSWHGTSSCPHLSPTVVELTARPDSRARVHSSLRANS